MLRCQRTSLFALLAILFLIVSRNLERLVETIAKLTKARGDVSAVRRSVNETADDAALKNSTETTLRSNTFMNRKDLGVLLSYLDEDILYRASLRLAEAVSVTVAMKQSGSFLQLHCPSSQFVGNRPGDHGDSRLMGSRCEAWANREWTEMVWHVLDKSMIGLEWSSGSGTLWTLRRGVSLHSVEHCKEWLDQIQLRVNEVIRNGINNTNGDESGPTWFPHHIATSVGCGQRSEDDRQVMDKIFGEYVRYPRLHLQQTYAPHGFDFINVDGRFRDGCLHEALQPGMLKPYGLLFLDNAERSSYHKPAEIPSHWLVASFQNHIVETALWMACPSVQDVWCTRARREINQSMKKLNAAVVGGRFSAHLQRAKQDGVPNA